MLTISWNKAALRQLDKAIDYIARESPQNAESVRKNMLIKIDALKSHPEMYALDKLKIDNEGNYRAFEMYHYRIAYWFAHPQIRIIRIRHTKMNPLYY